MNFLNATSETGSEDLNASLIITGLKRIILLARRQPSGKRCFRYHEQDFPPLSLIQKREKNKNKIIKDKSREKAGYSG